MGGRAGRFKNRPPSSESIAVKPKLIWVRSPSRQSVPKVLDDFAAICPQSSCDRFALIARAVIEVPCVRG